jgi:hypothetical protein
MGNIAYSYYDMLLTSVKFERIWVVQEIANAKEAVVHAGPYRIPWKSLCRIFRDLREYSMEEMIPNPSAIRAIYIMDRLQHQKVTEDVDFTDLELLERVRQLQSTIASDKLYGVLGLLKRIDMIKVDYTNSPEHVFKDLAIRHLETGSLHILYHCVESSQPTMLALPSWVPDWTRPGWVEPFHYRGLQANAAGNTKPQLQIDEAAGVLRLKGRILDTVRVVEEKYQIPLTKFTPSWSQEDKTDPKGRTKAKFMREQRSIYEGWENMTRLAWPTPEAFSWRKYESMWRNFMCNRTRDNDVPSPGYGQGWESVIVWLCNQTAEADSDPVPYIWTGIVRNGLSDFRSQLDPNVSSEERVKALEEKIATVRGAHMKWCYHRRFFVSEAERYGWAVDGTRPGDKVVLFYGCDFPFLVRDAAEGTCRIIGDCYIQGLMDGEGLNDEFEEYTFLIV